MVAMESDSKVYDRMETEQPDEGGVHGRVKRVMAACLDVPPISLSLDTTPDDLKNWDSIHHVDLILQLEKEFDIRFSPVAMAEIDSVESIIVEVTRELARKGTVVGGC